MTGDSARHRAAELRELREIGFVTGRARESALRAALVVARGHGGCDPAPVIRR